MRNIVPGYDKLSLIRRLMWPLDWVDISLITFAVTIAYLAWGPK